MVYYPLFLLPLWFSFYRQRGLARFSIGVIGSIAVMVLSLTFISTDFHSFWLKLRQMFALWWPKIDGLHGIWEFGWDPWFRLPIIALCGVLAVGLAIWPAHKNLGTLLSCSAAVMVSVQFWHGFGDGGGMYMAWYLPLLLMTVFRPNLEDRDRPLGTRRNTGSAAAARASPNLAAPPKRVPLGCVEYATRPAWLCFAYSQNTACHVSRAQAPALSITHNYGAVSVDVRGCLRWMIAAEEVLADWLVTSFEQPLVWWLRRA